MQGFGAFFAKETREFFRTWRGRIIVLLILVFAIASPILAYVMPDLLGSVASQAGLSIPDPTYIDAYAQWSKNILQMVSMALFIVMSGMIASEVQSGTAALVLSKPLSRPAFVIAKFLVPAIFVSLSLVLGAGICEVVTRVMFSAGDIEMLLKSTAVWILFALMLLAVMLLFSSRFKTLPAAGLGAVFYVGIAILTIWKPLNEYSPVGITGVANSFITGEHIDILWPIVTTIVFTIACVVGAVLLFRRREI